jgi:hypothetical protein
MSKQKFRWWNPIDYVLELGRTLTDPIEILSDAYRESLNKKIRNDIEYDKFYAKMKRDEQAKKEETCYVRKG